MRAKHERWSDLIKEESKVSPPVEELDITQDDANMIMKNLGIGHVEAMSYHKYGIVKERLVRMRDGSVVVRKRVNDCGIWKLLVSVKSHGV